MKGVFQMQNILVTGGAGYIGSHTVVELMNAGYTPLIVDNLSNSSIKVLDRIKQITGVDPKFYQADIADKAIMHNIFTENKIDAVIHFAAFKAVGESVVHPLSYYHNNVSGSISLFEVMQEHQVKTLVFSSSATVYGDPHIVPITEDFPLMATNPYGWTKFMMEQVLRDIVHADNSCQVAILRYFNPVGAHKSGLIGEDPAGIPNNLMPYVSQVAIGKRKVLNIFGNDYPTPDGTGVRDYIHVVDLAMGHVKALDYFKQSQSKHLLTLNLGTGAGYSVLDIVHAFEKISGKKINYNFMPRRPGDVATCYANPHLARHLIYWQAELDLEEMCQDAWRWQQQNPNGYNPV
jgi:UDP-glucose 4-epimerase